MDTGEIGILNEIQREEGRLKFVKKFSDLSQGDNTMLTSVRSRRKRAYHRKRTALSMDDKQLDQFLENKLLELKARKKGEKSQFRTEDLNVEKIISNIPKLHERVMSPYHNNSGLLGQESIIKQPFYGDSKAKAEYFEFLKQQNNRKKHSRGELEDFFVDFDQHGFEKISTKSIQKRKRKSFNIQKKNSILSLRELDTDHPNAIHRRKFSDPIETFFTPRKHSERKQSKMLSTKISKFEEHLMKAVQEEHKKERLFDMDGFQINYSELVLPPGRPNSFFKKTKKEKGKKSKKMKKRDFGKMSIIETRIEKTKEMEKNYSHVIHKKYFDFLKDISQE